MKKFAIAALVAAPLLSAPVFAEDDGVDFSDPSVVFSSFEFSFGSEGASLGYGIAAPINEDWNALGKAEIKEDFDIYRVRAAAISNKIGTGVMFDYIYNTNTKSHTPVINALQVLPIAEGTMLVPILGAGMIAGTEVAGLEQDNTVAISMAQMMFIHNFSDTVWATVIPQYTYSFNDMKLAAGDTVVAKNSIRQFDLEAFVGYKFGGNQNVKLQYKGVDVGSDGAEDNQYWVAYTYAF